MGVAAGPALAERRAHARPGDGAPKRTVVCDATGSDTKH